MLRLAMPALVAGVVLSCSSEEFSSASVGGAAGEQTGGAPGGGSAGAPSGGSAGAPSGGGAGTSSGGGAGAGSAGAPSGGAAGGGGMAGAAAGGAAGSAGCGGGGGFAGAGEVLAVTNAAGDNIPEYPVLDSTHVYWSTTQSVWRVPKTGGCPAQLASGGGQLEGIAVSGQFVYYADSSLGAVRRASVNGGAIATIATGQSGVQTVAVDAQNVFWAARIAGAVRRGGSNPGVPCTTSCALIAQSIEPFAIAESGLYVYWITRAGTAHRALKIGGGLESLSTSSGTAGVVHIGLYQNRIYWTYQHTGGGVRSVTLEGLNPINSVAQADAEGVAVDGSNVYFARAAASGSVARVGAALVGATPAVIASDQAIPRGVAVDASHIYWVNGADGTVRRLPKP
jgi:hypothetical protein